MVSLHDEPSRARIPKHIKEQFYKGHTGASQQEVTSLVLCMPLLIILAEVIKGHTCISRLQDDAKSVPLYRRVAAFMVELLVGMLPQVALYTELLPAQTTCSALSALLALWAVARLRSHITLNKLAAAISGSAHSPQDSSDSSLAASSLQEAVQNLTVKRRRFVSVFRGSLMLGTCACILAVDFRAFPRRYAKAEDWGMGLMDVGVGGMVLAGGLVTYTSRPANAATQTQQSILWRLLRGLRAGLPCCLLWAARVVSVKATEYQEHVGEYGVHWNFFATLACLAVLRHVVVLPDAWAAPLALVVTATHQATLSWTGVGPWMRDPRRDPGSLLSLNKEGIGSLPGYWALALAGTAMGAALHASMSQAAGQVQDRLAMLQDAGGRNPENTALAKDVVQTSSGHAPVAGKGRPAAGQPEVNDSICTASSSCQTKLQLWQVLMPMLRPLLAWVFVCMCLWLSLGVLHTYIEPVSRRCANMTYVVWVTTLSLTTLLVLLVGQLLLPGGLRPVLPLAAATNMLPVFLIANLLTGLVNISIDTLQVSDTSARFIVCAYMLLVCGVAAVLDAFGIVIKL